MGLTSTFPHDSEALVAKSCGCLTHFVPKLFSGCRQKPFTITLVPELVPIPAKSVQKVAFPVSVPLFGSVAGVVALELFPR